MRRIRVVISHPYKYLNVVRTVVFVMLLFGFSYVIAIAADDDKEAVQQTLLNSALAFEQKDISAQDKLWMNDDSVIVFENGNADYGWSNYRNHHLVPEMQEIQNIKYTLSDIVPHVDSMMAWATFKYSISGDLPERHVEGNGVGTAILQKKNNRWLIVHWHSSSPRKPQPAQTEEKKEDSQH